MPGEGKRTGSQPASAMYSGRLGQAPAGLSFIYLSAVSWEVRREEMAEASFYQRGLTGSWGIGNIIGLLSLLAMAPIWHFSLPNPPTLLADISEERRQCWPFRPWAETTPNKTCHLCLQWHLFDRRRFFFLPSPRPFPLHSAAAFLFGLSCNSGNLNAAWLGLPTTTAVRGKWLCCEGQATC